MNIFRFAALSLLLAALAPAGRAQVLQARITIALPAVLPPVVVVEPGVQVFEDIDEEVFLVDGWYWARRGPHWYRARDHRQAWLLVDSRFVPVRLRRIPPGQYRRFHKAEWKRMKEEEKERRHAEKEAAKRFRKEEHRRHHHDED